MCISTLNWLGIEPQCTMLNFFILTLSVKLIFSSGADGFLKLWNLAGKCHETKLHPSAVSMITTSNNVVACGANFQGQIYIYNYNSIDNSLDLSLNLHHEGVSCLQLKEEYSGPPKLLVSGSNLAGTNPGDIRIWNTGKEKLIQTYQLGMKKCHSVEWIDRLITVGTDSSIVRFDVEANREVQSFVAHSGWIKSLQSEDDILITGSTDKTVKIWDLRVGDGVPIKQFLFKR